MTLKSFLVSLVNLNIGSSFVGTGALRAAMLILKAQIFLFLQTRALAFWPKQIVKTQRFNQ